MTVRELNTRNVFHEFEHITHHQYSILGSNHKPHHYITFVGKFKNVSKDFQLPRIMDIDSSICNIHLNSNYAAVEKNVEEGTFTIRLLTGGGIGLEILGFYIRESDDKPVLYIKGERFEFSS